MILQAPDGPRLTLSTVAPFVTLLPLGTEVSSGALGRDRGIIFAYNIGGDLFYPGTRYPYAIVWEDGFIEVYSQQSFEVVA